METKLQTDPPVALHRLVRPLPGPWSYWPDSAYPEGVVSQDKTGGHVARPIMFHDRELTTATARLIAAAPDLLAALECWPLTELIEMADDRVLTRLKWFMEIRAEALKKACGDGPNTQAQPRRTDA